MSRAFSLYLDAVRFTAAMLVLFFHANVIYRPGILLTSLGHEAVVIFFVLSGFVIAYVADTRETDFRGFMVARGARIFSVAIPAIIAAKGTIVEALDLRNGHRKVAARLTLLKLKAQMHPDCFEAVERQLELWRNMVGVEE